jgi:ornithine decarboxylase
MHRFSLNMFEISCASSRKGLKPNRAWAMTKRQLQTLAKEHGTPLVIIDHDVIRRNYAEFKEHLPKVQAYYAVKANPAPEIIHTLYKAGASFDVASMPEFMLVYENIKHMPAKAQQAFIWDKII